ncbi:MAG: tetratricopeptide repeat protein [Deltaproteobacteria bacterium]|nr:tetratricopeptide repeat protein [Deltaproteobacteria bacterium]
MKIPNKAFKIIYAFFSLVLLCLYAGCSTVYLSNRQVSDDIWVCHNTADKAMMEGNIELGILLHQRFLEKESKNALSLYHLGYAYGQTGDYLKEVFYYENAIALNFKTESIFFNLGMAYGELRQTEKSIRSLEKALEINPNSPDNHFALGTAYCQKSIADELAEKEFLKAIEIDPEHVDARLYLSIIYADKGEFKKAGKQLRQILKIDPTHKIAQEYLESIDNE